MGLKVIGAGFARTGTLSLKIALEKLGFEKCYHMFEVFKHPEHCSSINDAKDGKDVDWDSLFHGYKASVDWPMSSFYKQLMVKYPDAKVILTVRDAEKWYESVTQTVHTAKDATFLNSDVMLPMIHKVVWDGIFDGNFEDKDHAISIYKKHIAEVKAHVPPEKLLVFHVKDGWAPLCKFLGLETPAEPFPHLNERSAFQITLGAEP